MDLSLVGKYGECVFDTFVDRLTASSITIREAWLRPAECPFLAKIDVTAGFMRILGRKGGMFLLNEGITPDELVAASASPQRRAGFWRVFMPMQTQRAEAAPLSGTHWLCVKFSVPGNVDFVACYKIPDEVVTFPPASTDPKSMTPIERQIISAAVVDASDPDEDEPTVLIDFTRHLQCMAGPNGDFFGRATVDARLAIAETINSGNAEKYLYALLDHSLSLKSVANAIEYANGAKITVNARYFPCAP